MLRGRREVLAAVFRISEMVVFLPSPSAFGRISTLMRKAAELTRTFSMENSPFARKEKRDPNPPYAAHRPGSRAVRETLRQTRGWRGRVFYGSRTLIPEPLTGRACSARDFCAPHDSIPGVSDSWVQWANLRPRRCGAAPTGSRF